MFWGLLFAATSMTLIVALRYLASSGLFAWLTRKLRPGQYDGLEQQISEIIQVIGDVFYGQRFDFFYFVGHLKDDSKHSVT